MRQNIKRFLERLDGRKLGLSRKIKVKSISKLGLGESHANFLVKIANKKFIFRLQMNKKSQDSPKGEYKALKDVEKISIFPKAYLTGKIEHGTFIIIDYQEGRSIRGIKVTKDFVKKLARLIAKMHSYKPKMRKFRGSYKEIVKEGNIHIDYIKNISKDKDLVRLLEKTFIKIKKITKNVKHKNIFCLCHGDICENNLIVYKNELKLVDFEDLSLKDPAYDIRILFRDFKLNDNMKKLFFKEYFKIRKDKTIKQRIKIFYPLIQFEEFTWAIMHVFEIKLGDMHNYFIKNKDIKKDIKFAKYVFERCLKNKIIDKKWAKLGRVSLSKTP